MKKIIVTLAAGLMLAAPLAVVPSMPARAEAKIGVIDVQRILSSSALLKALEGAQRDVQQAEQTLIESRNKKMKELQEKQGKISEDEFLKLKRKYEDEIMQQAKSEETKLERKKEEIQKMKDKLEKDVEAVVQTVAKKKGLDMVVNKQLVLFGGTDITTDVVNELKNRK